MTEEQATVLATIYGEAAGSSPAAWRAIAHVIRNRVGKREWRKYLTQGEIAAKTGFDAFTMQNQPFCEAYADLCADPPHYTTRKLKELVDVCLPVLDGKESGNLGGAILYYSPKAQAALHKQNPSIWPALPRWNFSLLKEVDAGLEPGDDFRFFAYR